MSDTLFKRKKKRGATTTTIKAASASESEEEASAVVVKAKRKDLNPLRQSTVPSLKRQKLTDDHSDDDDTAHLDHFGEYSVTSSAKPGFSSNLTRNKDDATRHTNWDLEVDSSSLPTGVDARNPQPSAAPSNDDGLYHGSKSYSSFVPTRDTGASSKMNARGPIRAAANVRTITLMDYQPDICKDYKETGYCGFGDTCKFLHDRSDYLAGWQLDLMPNSSTRARDAFGQPEEEDEEEEDVPFACLICRKPFTDPVVTRCGHYFCSACAIKRYAKTPKCFACGAQTNGLFNSATNILAKMEAKNRRRAADKEEQRRAYGQDPDSDSEPLQLEIGAE